MHMDRYLGNVILTRNGNSVLLDTYMLSQQENTQISLKQLERMYLPKINCINCEYLGHESTVDCRVTAVCNAVILGDGSGRPMMSVCCEHEWCPKLKASTSHSDEAQESPQ